ncbi:MAG: MFS transporter [Thermoplasmatota archaeon]
MKKIFFYNGLTRNIIIVGVVSLFTDLSSQMVFPLIPLYLVTLGASAWIIGLVEGSAETTASLLKVFSGYWSDKMKRRKPFVLAGYSISTITKPLFAFATIWPFVLLIRIIERIGKGIRNAPRDAIIAESCDISCRGKAYGFHRAMDGAGSIAGALLAFILLPVLGFKNIFLFAAIPGVFAVFCIIFIKEKKSDKIQKTQPLKVSLKKLPFNLKLFLFVSIIFSFAHFGYAFILLKAKQIQLDNQYIILLYVLFYIVYTLFSIPTGIASDKIGRKPIIISGYILFSIACVGLVFTNNVLLLVIMFVLYGLFYAMVDGVQRAFVVDLSPKQLKATALGTYHTSVGLAALPAGLLLGIIWDKLSPEVMFIYSLCLALFALLVFVFVKNKK